jgi:hypothetical protein
VVLAVVFVLAWLVVRGPLPVDPAPSIRAITPDLVPADGPLLLAWEGGAPPYRARLVDGRGEILWESTELPGAAVELPPRVRGRLVSGETYRWTVQARDVRNRPYRSQPFSLRVAPPRDSPPTRPG